MGRFDVIGLPSGQIGDIARFIQTIKAAKEENFVLPDEYTTGTRPSPRPTSANLSDPSSWPSRGHLLRVQYKYNKFTEKYYYETKVKTVITFYNVEEDKIGGIAGIETRERFKEPWCPSRPP